MNDQTKAAVPATMLPTGGLVAAIVPQTFEEIQRIANTIIAAGIAPQALIYRPRANENVDQNYVKQRNIAAVASAIMAGAELGLPPFVALRSFTVINGRPALYADGNVAVVRKAKDADGKPVCEYIRQGFERAAVGAGGFVPDDEMTFAWCEAKRADTGEIHREQFSVADAKTAGLWDPEPTVEREVWEGPSGQRKAVKRMVVNDAPWHRYPKRMMMWRATGYCLRWLFADVLGGMPDEYEAREIAGRMIDITPLAPPPARPTPPSAPPPPDEPPEGEPPAGEPPTGHADTSDTTTTLNEWDGLLMSARTPEALEQVWDELNAPVVFAGDDEALQRAFDLIDDHRKRVAKIAASPTAGENTNGDT